MDDLISRQAAIELIESEYRRWGEEYGITDVLCDLDDMPAAEPRKGKWIDYCGGVKCDQCGFECDDTYYLGEANYCPNCGARMEESDGNSD